VSSPVAAPPRVDRIIDDAVGLLIAGIDQDGLAWFAAGGRVEGPSNPLEVADREERLAQWLTARSVTDAWHLAADLAELGFDVTALDAATERHREQQELPVGVERLFDLAELGITETAVPASGDG
jgi:hypothetical protein